MKIVSLRSVSRIFGLVPILCCISLMHLGGTLTVAAEVTVEKPVDEKAGDEKVPAKAGRVLKDVWELIELAGAPAGYGRMREYFIERDGETLRQIESVLRMRMQRLGQKVEAAIFVQATFHAKGNMLDFRTETDLGGQAMITTGSVKGQHLEMATEQGGRVTTQRIRWSSELHGFFYEQRLLENNPMVPGEQRTFSTLVPIFNRVAKTTLRAGDWSSTDMLGDSKKLLPIQSETKLSGQQFTTTLWMDRDGQILKTEEPTLGQTVTRTTKEKALAKQRAAPPDLIAETVIPLKAESTALAGARAARYRVQTARATIKPPFPNSVCQVCTPTESRATWNLLVSAKEDQNLLAKDGQIDLPQAADRKPNRYIDQSDAAVRQLAEAVGAAQTETALAKALSKKVYLWITRKDFSTVLATATEVARTRTGDCTEHAVLLAALARARGLPARVVVGLVYVPSLGGFAYHMWNQIWCDGAWRFFDATQTDGRCGAGHIKVADAALDDQSGLTVFLPVLQIMGGTEIELKEVVADRDR